MVYSAAMYEQLKAMGAVMANWETFRRRAAPVSTVPMVTIQKRGTLSFNRPAFEALGEPSAVELLYDREERVVGLRPIDPAAPHAYQPRQQGKTANWLVSGRAFTQYFGIETDTARRYPAVLQDDVLTVDLKQPGSDATGVRGRELPTRPGLREEDLHE